MYGTYFDGVFDCAPGNATGNCAAHGAAMDQAHIDARRAMLRPHIKAALLTW